jgi:hypothetical protein
MLKNTCVITFANTDIHKNYQKEFHELYKNNFFNHVAYTERDIISTDFYQNNMQMFQYTKYFGYFLWKPFIILETMKLFPNSRVLYCDSNLRFNDFPSFEVMYNTLMDAQEAFFVKHDNFINKDWTKYDTFYLMGCDNEKYWNARQVWTPLMGFGTSGLVSNLLSEYMHCCKVPEIITEEPNIYGKNLAGFREHRWEQSVMSILVEKYGYNGVTDSQIMMWVTKIYSKELMIMKEKVNENPLDKSIQLF